MATRALITFSELGWNPETKQVEKFDYCTYYQHWDGYPEHRGREIARFIQKYDEAIEPIGRSIMPTAYAWANVDTDTLTPSRLRFDAEIIPWEAGDEEVMGEQYHYHVLFPVKHTDPIIVVIKERNPGEDTKREIFRGTAQALLEKYPSREAANA